MADTYTLVDTHTVSVLSTSTTQKITLYDFDFLTAKLDQLQLDKTAAIADFDAQINALNVILAQAKLLGIVTKK